MLLPEEFSSQKSGWCSAEQFCHEMTTVVRLSVWIYWCHWGGVTLSITTDTILEIKFSTDRIGDLPYPNSLPLKIVTNWEPVVHNKTKSKQVVLFAKFDLFPAWECVKSHAIHMEDRPECFIFQILLQSVQIGARRQVSRHYFFKRPRLRSQLQ